MSSTNHSSSHPGQGAELLKPAAPAEQQQSGHLNPASLQPGLHSSQDGHQPPSALTAVCVATKKTLPVQVSSHPQRQNSAAEMQSDWAEELKSSIVHQAQEPGLGAAAPAPAPWCSVLLPMPALLSCTKASSTSLVRALRTQGSKLWPARK